MHALIVDIISTLWYSRIMKTKRKLTKRQILNELLEVHSRQLKLRESQDRLSARKNKEFINRNELAGELEILCKAEAKKNGEEDFDVEEPILFKSHVFVIDAARALHKTTIDIQAAKSVS